MCELAFSHLLVTLFWARFSGQLWGTELVLVVERGWIPFLSFHRGSESGLCLKGSCCRVKRFLFLGLQASFPSVILQTSSSVPGMLQGLWGASLCSWAGAGLCGSRGWGLCGPPVSPHPSQSPKQMKERRQSMFSQRNRTNSTRSSAASFLPKPACCVRPRAVPPPCPPQSPSSFLSFPGQAVQLS